MGHNRSGVERKARLRRRKKEMERLARTPRPASAKSGEAKSAAPEPAK